MFESEKRWALIATSVGIVAAAAAVAADLALQYTSNIAHVGSDTYQYLLDVTPGRILFGHFVGVIAVLLEIVGFWGVSRFLSLSGRVVTANTFFLVAAFTYGVGAAFHAMFGVIGLVLQSLSRRHVGGLVYVEVIEAVRRPHDLLGAVTLPGILVSSVFIGVAVASGRTVLPRWLVFLTPLPVMLVMFGVLNVSFQVRAFLLPCGLNLANVVMFSAIATVVRLKNRRVT